MKHFEEQVSQAAARLRNEENSRLRVPRNPRRSGGVSWGWVATPVAAVAGLLWGVELFAGYRRKAGNRDRGRDFTGADGEMCFGRRHRLFHALGGCESR